MMKTGSQLAWVMVRSIGLILLLYSAGRLVSTVGGTYVAFTLRNHSAIVIESTASIPDHQKDTPENRQRLNAYGHARASATLNGFLFLISLAGCLYCLKGGKTLHKLLMPPEDTEAPNQTIEPTGDTQAGDFD